MKLEQQFYHVGIGAGLPYRALNAFANAVDETTNARLLARRREVARRALIGSRWVGYIPREKGYARVAPGTLPGADEAIECVRAIVEGTEDVGWKARPNNPFHQLERPEHFRDYPALTEFVLSDAVLQIVSDYYGMVPQLKGVGIWLTPPQTERFGSQLYHLDKPEAQIVGLFLNVNENSASAGPLTILPADVSRRVRAETDYDSIYFRGDGRLSDDAVFDHCGPKDQIVLEPTAGAGIFADTSNCFHFGSRSQGEVRIMLTMKFTLPHKVRKLRTPLFDLIPKPADEVRTLVLAGARLEAP